MPATEVRPFNSLSAILLLLFVIAAGAASVPLSQVLSPESLSADLLKDLSAPRPLGALLFHNSSRNRVHPDMNSRLREAQISVLSVGDPAVQQRIQSLIHLGTGNWTKAAEILTNLTSTEPNNAEFLNDLGVVYLSLGSQNAIFYFKALQLFESAKQLAPTARAPRFNAVLAYRFTALEEFEREAWTQYKKSEVNPDWIDELTPRTSPSDLELIE